MSEEKEIEDGMIFHASCQMQSGATENLIDVVSKALVSKTMSCIPSETNHSSSNKGKHLATNLAVTLVVFCL